MAGKYDKYVVNPPHIQIRAEEDGRVVFNGLMVDHKLLNYNLTLGHQFVTKPFVSDNPCHTHNFQEFLAWYGANLNDPEDFGAEIVLYLGEEQEKHVFTRFTIVSLSTGIPSLPADDYQSRSAHYSNGNHAHWRRWDQRSPLAPG